MTFQKQAFCPLKSPDGGAMFQSCALRQHWRWCFAHCQCWLPDGYQTSCGGRTHLTSSSRLLMAAQCSSVTFSLSGCRTSWPASTSSLQRSRTPNLTHTHTGTGGVTLLLLQRHQVNITRFLLIHHLRFLSKLNSKACKREFKQWNCPFFLSCCSTPPLCCEASCCANTTVKHSLLLFQASFSWISHDNLWGK